MNILQLILSIISGIVACIPLAIKLVQYVQAAAKEKNWQKLLALVMAEMQTAEEGFTQGASKKEYVMKSVESLASTIDYPINTNELSSLIDALCELTKNVNI